ncbi:MAG: methyltransferase domain-containing protein [Ignavibacteriales bacterium]|jgi:SAM-dependent methyltransferase|nr:MAG: methyltransferase domain-containing protein [Ignavibacteriales bacterium]
MKTKEQIHLPGGNSQLNFTLENVDLLGKTILVIGAGSEFAVKLFLKNGATKIELIVEDYDSLLNSRLALDQIESINPKMMDFEITDFNENTFDVVYTQASISGSKRNRIIKEIKRIIKNDGILIVGEIVKLEKLVPQFVNDMFSDSDLDPLYTEDIKNYYFQRGWDVQEIINHSDRLNEYYSTNLDMLSKSLKELSDNEKSYYKKLINQISHQSKAYLKQGADRFIGFSILKAIMNDR